MIFSNDATVLNVDVENSYKYIEDSVGIVVKTKDETGTNAFGVYVPRLMCLIDMGRGPEEKSKSLSKVSSKIKNSKNKNIGETTVKIKNYVEIVPFVIPNISMPNYRKGEKVLISFIDNDIKSPVMYPYGWDDLVRRKTDKAELWVPAKKKEYDELSSDNMYRLYLDSENKYISLHMSKANDEVSSYTIVIDGKNGILKVTDDGKRNIEIDTRKDSITVNNETGSSIKMERNRIKVETDFFEVNAKQSIKLKTNSYDIEYSNGKEKGTSLNSEITTVKEKGNRIESNYNSRVEKGIDNENNYSAKIVNESKVISLMGDTNVKSLGFMAIKGMPKPFTYPGFDDKGSGSIAFPAQMAKSVAIAQYVNSCLLSIATSVDILYGMFGIPPKNVAQVTSVSPVMPSILLKG